MRAVKGLVRRHHCHHLQHVIQLAMLHITAMPFVHRGHSCPISHFQSVRLGHEDKQQNVMDWCVRLCE